MYKHASRFRQRMSEAGRPIGERPKKRSEGGPPAPRLGPVRPFIR
jgi:hypothetical protein